VRVHRYWGGVRGELSPVTEGAPLGGVRGELSPVTEADPLGAAEFAC